MGYVIHNNRLFLFTLDQLADLGDRFWVKDHTFAKDNDFRVQLFQDLGCFVDIDPVRVVFANREIDHRESFGDRILGDIIA